MATISPQYTPQTAITASQPSQWGTRAMTPHGLVTVQSRYNAATQQWTHTIPSHSQPGMQRHVTAGACDCPARRTCWHRLVARRVEAQLHETLWGVLAYEFCLVSSTDAYGRGLDAIRQMHIPVGGYRQTRDAAITAMEALS